MTDGGLGLFNIEAKANANLVTSFLQTAGCNDYVTNWFHKALFYYYVCDVGPKAPPRPPYYSQDFFNIIKKKKEEGADVFSMKVKDWSGFLVEPYLHNMEEIEKPLLISRI